MSRENKNISDNPVNEFIVSGIRHLTESTFILRFSRGGMKFSAGQHIIVGLHGEMDMREYSIYSGENDDHLEILVKEVKEGNISVKLKHCQPGQKLDVNGPFGSFGIEEYDRYSRNHVFIATGTGISPFHSFIKSYPGLDYTLIHGVAYSGEAYDMREYDKRKYILCTSKEQYMGKQGRVTGLISELTPDPGMLFYLCGNGSMIHDVYRILKEKGVPPAKILTERYF
ncbi:MAG: FAD-binding oxidoreductase [Bacteroidales bacterium]